MKRRFELAGTPVRFWEIAGGTYVNVSWGEVGKAVVNRRDRSFDSLVDAQAYEAAQIAAQVAKGYVEIIAAPPTAVETAVDAPPTNLGTTRRERFEWSTGAHDHFTLVAQDGNRILWRVGRVTNGVSRTDRHENRDYPSVEQASQRYNELCADARYQGGTVVPAARRPAYRAHRNPELEAACVESASPDSWAVYADWLQTQGDLLGELAALHLGGKAADASRLLDARVLELCGVEGARLSFEFRHGFARAATVAITSDHEEYLEVVTRRFLEAPVGRFVESLRFGLAGFEASNNSWTATLAAVAESAQAPRIRELRFDAYDNENGISWVGYGDFSKHLSKLPALELLHIKSGVGGSLGVIDLPRLRTFIRESGGLGRSEIDQICTASWPRLDHLEIWFGSSQYGAAGTVLSLRPILDAKHLPQLKHLGIVNAEFVEEAIVALASSRLLPRLDSLDLSKGVMAKAGADAFVEHAAAFRHLAAIDLTENLLSDHDIARIRAVLDNVITVDQREQSGEARYVAVGE